MAREEKPYRVYRGGRATGKVPTTRSARIRPAKDGGSGRSDYRGPATGRQRPVRWGRRIALGLGGLLLLIVLWGIAGWISVSSGVSSAHERLTPDARAVLVSQSGLL